MRKVLYKQTHDIRSFSLMDIPNIRENIWLGLNDMEKQMALGKRYEIKLTLKEIKKD